jgi:hypothetical protein
MFPHGTSGPRYMVHDGRSPAVIPGRGRERFGGAPCCYCARVRPTRSAPPEGPPREQKLKIKGESAPGPCFPSRAGGCTAPPPTVAKISSISEIGGGFLCWLCGQ